MTKFGIGQTARVTKNVYAVQDDGLVPAIVWLHAQDLVRITELRTTSRGPAVHVACPHYAGWLFVTDLCPDDSLPLFDEYRRECTGCLF